MSLPLIWLIGNTREAVFAEPLGWLQLQFRCICFDSPAVVGVGIDHATDDAFPIAIVLLQTRPGQFSAREIEKLHGREPLARLVTLTGPWCEGEQRSGRPIPGVVRVAWRNWRERLPLEFAINGNRALWPRTLTEIDRIETRRESASDITPRCGQVTICAARSADYNYLSDAVQQLGISATLFGSTGTSAANAAAEAVIFDGWDQATQFERDQQSKSAPLKARLILLLHFPRPEDHTLVDTAGIDAVLPHPLSIADLNAALARILPCAA